MKLFQLFFSLMFLNQVFASSLPSQDALNSDQVVSNLKSKRSSLIPSDKVLGSLDEAKIDEFKHIKDQEFKKKLEDARAFFKNMEKKKIEDTVKLQESSIKKIKIEKNYRKKRIVKNKTLPKVESGILLINAPVVDFDYYDSITLPSGSSALATLLAGVEVGPETRKVNARLDYAFLGPNKSVVELNDCHIWIEVAGNYNTERIYGNGNQLVCRTDSGKTFEVTINAQLRDYKDEYIGKKAELVTRGKIAATALQFLQSGVKEFGKAMAAAQVVTEVVPGGPNTDSQTVSNISDSEKYIAGKSVSGATSDFLGWWIDYYKSLSPTLAMAPGSKVFLTITGSVQIPREFFKNTNMDKNSILRTNTNIVINREVEDETIN